MNHLHSQFDAGPDDVIEVGLDGQANVMLMDDGNYHAYQRGDKFQYYGGLARRSPARLQPPRWGRWHVVVDLGGYSGSVRAGVCLLQGVHSAG